MTFSSSTQTSWYNLNIKLPSLQDTCDMQSVEGGGIHQIATPRLCSPNPENTLIRYLPISLRPPDIARVVSSVLASWGMSKAHGKFVVWCSGK